MFTQNPIRIALAVILCSIGVFTNAQTVWNITYLDDRPVMVFGGVNADDTGYLVIGITVGHKYNDTKALAGYVDPAGNLSNYNILTDSFAGQCGLFRNALIKTTDGNYAFTGYSYDSLPSLLFGMAYPRMDSISLFRYYMPNTMAYHGNALIQKNKCYYITGVRTDSLQNDPNVFLVKIDSAGNKIYEKKFGVSNRQEEGQSIIPLSNGNLLIGAARLNVLSVIETAQTWLIEVDTNGNLIRQWRDPIDSTYEAFGLKQTPDGGFIYATKKKTEDRAGDPVSEGLVVKLDSSFQKEWEYKEGDRSIYNSMRDIEIDEDGNFIACGSISTTNSDIMSGWVVKLNVFGQVIWAKAYRGIQASNTYNYLTDIDILPDGSLIAVGQCWGNGQGPVQVGWFLKLDSNGCEMENCLVGIEDNTTPKSPKGDFNSQIQLQPNPASGYVQLTIENEMLGGIISLYNITGALVMQQKAEAEKTQLNIATLSKGMYVVTIQRQNSIARAKLVVE